MQRRLKYFERTIHPTKVILGALALTTAISTLFTVLLLGVQ